MTDQRLAWRVYRGKPDDLRLAEIAAGATGEPYSAEKITYDLSIPGTNQKRDITVCEFDGQIVAFGQVVIDDVRDVRQGRLVSRIEKNPQLESQVAREILLWAARRMQEEIVEGGRPVTIVEMVKEEELARREFLEDAGFLAIRYYKVMHLTEIAGMQELPLPAGHSYIHSPGAQGAEEYVAMFNETWIDHYGFIPLTVAEYLHDIIDDPDYSSELDIVIKRDDGRFVGFSLCRIEPSDTLTGEVLAIGIRRGSRGLGLGRVLLTHSIRALADAGAEQVELTVDSENSTGAERLYESVGFKVISMKRRYQLSEDSVIRLATLNVC